LRFHSPEHPTEKQRRITGASSELRDSRDAQAHAARAFELAPEDYGTATELVEIYCELDDLPRAEQMFAVAVNIVSRWPKEKQREKDAEKKRLDGLRAQIDARLPAAPAAARV